MTSTEQKCFGISMILTCGELTLLNLGTTVRLHIMIVSYVHNMLLHYRLNLSLCCVHDLYPGIFPEPTMIFHKSRL